MSTEHILSVIDSHADSAAILLLPGVQYYTGQLFDIPLITKHAHKVGIVVLWDLAHAVGNIELKLHEWNVDGAAWCGYKYLNGGPGCIGGLFLHERHDSISVDGAQPTPGRGLRGWWGTNKEARFQMDTSHFVPGLGAASMQLSNPSVICTTALCASLEVFREAGGMKPLRAKSVQLTKFMYNLLDGLRTISGEQALFEIITPQNESQRGAQLSIRLKMPGSLDIVAKALAALGCYIDERRPDVIRIAPTPLYNTFSECCDFVEAFGMALGELIDHSTLT